MTPVNRLKHAGHNHFGVASGKYGKYVLCEWKEPALRADRLHLGLRPLRKVLRIAKLAARSPTVEAPVGAGAGAIDAAIPGAGFAAPGGEVRDSAAAQALAREQTDFELRLVEPTAVEGRVVHGKALPQLAAGLRAIAVGQGLAAVNIEIVHHQVNGPGTGILAGQCQAHLRELAARTIR